MDDDLMQKAAAGDMRAFGRLVTTHQGRLVRFATSMLGNREVAEDAVQEAFVRLWQTRARYQADGHFSSYLFRIARNVCLDYIRAEGHCGIKETRDDGAETAMGNGPGPVVQGEAFSDAIYRAVLELPESQRTVFTLSQYEGLTYQEIADVLGCPVGTVASRKHLAMETLRRRLRPWMEGE